MSAGRARRAGIFGDTGVGVMRAGLAGAKGGVSRAVPKSPSQHLCNPDIRNTELPDEQETKYPAKVHER